MPDYSLIFCNIIIIFFILIRCRSETTTTVDVGLLAYNSTLDGVNYTLFCNHFEIRPRTAQTLYIAQWAKYAEEEYDLPFDQKSPIRRYILRIQQYLSICLAGWLVAMTRWLWLYVYDSLPPGSSYVTLASNYWLNARFPVLMSDILGLWTNVCLSWSRGVKKVN